LLAAFVIALFLDIPVSRWAHDVGLAHWLKDRPNLTHLLRFPGHFLFTIAACIVLLAMTPRHGWSKCWHNTAIVFLSGIFSGVNAPLKWSIGRLRPFHGATPFELHPFKGGIHGSWLAEQNLSFPSGDASLAFAMSASLSMVAPKLWPLWWAMGLLVAAERVAENAHYPSDTVAAGAVGIVAAMAARWVVRKCWPQPSASEPV
jgi:membrane-associated phospholipid phosphatase